MAMGGELFKYKPGDIYSKKVKNQGWLYFYVFGTDDFNPVEKNYPQYVVACFGLIKGDYKYMDSKFVGYHTKAFDKYRGMGKKWFEGVEYLWRTELVTDFEKEFHGHLKLAQKAYDAFIASLDPIVEEYERSYKKSQIKYLFK